MTARQDRRRASAAVDGHPPRPRQPRWGLRTLAFLALALVSVLASNAFYARGVTDFVLATLAGTVVGFVGAAYCSIRGLQAWNGLSRM